MRLAEARGNEAEWRPVRERWKRERSCCMTFQTWIGLAALTRTYGLPDQAPVLLFALGRTLGTSARAIEEYASGQLIRPRARSTRPTLPWVVWRDPRTRRFGRTQQGRQD